jgi:hypothetical protein
VAAARVLVLTTYDTDSHVLPAIARWRLATRHPAGTLAAWVACRCGFPGPG